MATNKQGRSLRSAHPDVKGSSEVVQVGLDETNVPQAQLGAAALSPQQRLFLVLDEDDLKARERDVWLISAFISGGNKVRFTSKTSEFQVISIFSNSKSKIPNS